MARGLKDVVARLRGVAASQALGGLPDGELLRRFAGSADGAAFAALVERHGRMVLGVCRRSLPCRHDAEDACQAVFLVLARKAGSLAREGALAGWLHAVAHRVSASSRRDAALRKAREAGAAPPDPAEAATRREARVALDEELGRMPGRYREPLVLCYLEGLTREEAAARLGLSTGALHGRLERGRAALRERLERRGLSLPSALAALPGGAVPPLLAVTTADAAAAFAAGQTPAVGAAVIALTKEALMSMTVTKVKLYAAAALLAAVVGGALLPYASAQVGKAPPRDGGADRFLPAEKGETDEAFLRRVSRDLRESDPTPTEVHFFASSKDPKKRQRVIDLFIQERQAKKEALARPEKEEATRTETFALKHAAASDIAASLAKLVNGKVVRVVADERANRVIVQARASDMARVRTMLEAADLLAEPKGGALAPRVAPPKGLLPEFKELDKNEDGQIDPSEWRKAGRRADEFRDVDLNGDGAITLEEFRRYLKKLGQ